jgi:peptide/nickel transport system substrate-binding protein
MRHARWIVAVVAALTLGGPASAVAATGDWRLGYVYPMDSLNPIVSSTGTALGVVSMSYDTLLAYSLKDQTPDLEHSLAKSYEVSSDGLTSTFHLREGVTWSDGEPFTSADVKWTIEAILGDPASPASLGLAGVKQVSTPDPQTVVVKTDKPNGNIGFLTILPKHVWSKLSKKQIDKGPGPLPNVTTGPFVITKFDPRGTTILEANPRYRFGAPKAKRIVWVKYGDLPGLLRDLRLKQLDASAEGKPDWVKLVRGDRNLKVWPADSPNLQMIGFNSCPPQGAGACEKPGPNVHVKVVQDPAIRQAINLAIDRKQIVDTVYDGQATPGLTGMIAPFYVSYAPKREGDERANLDAARKALTDGGWDCSSNPCVKDGTKAEFKLLYDPADTVNAQLAQRVRAQVSAVNIKVDLDPQSTDAQGGVVNAPGSKEGTFRPNYDAIVSGWTGLPFSPDILMSLLTSSSPFPEVYYSNPEYDRLFGQAQNTIDVKRRAAIFDQANAIARRDLPYVVVLNGRSITVTRTDTWHGYQAALGGHGSPWGVNAVQVAGLQPGPAPRSSSPVSAGDDGGGSTGIVIAIVAAIVVVGIGALLVVRGRRRRGGGSDSDAGWTEA